MPFLRSSSSVSLWESSLCVDCFLKQTRRHLSSTLRSSSREQSAVFTDVQGNTPFRPVTRDTSASLRRRRDFDPLKKSPTAIPSTVRAFATSSTVQQLDRLIRRSSERPQAYNGNPASRRERRDNREYDHKTKNSGNGIRTLLKDWRPQDPILPVPQECFVESLDGKGTTNNLTRPETSDSNAADGFSMFDEHAQAYIKDFERITDATSGGAQLGSMLNRGDLVELRGNANSPLLAVYLGISQNLFFQFYTVSGKLYSASYRTAQFQVEGYFDPSELDPIMSYIPAVTEESDVDIMIPRNISAPILNKMVNFRIASDNMYRKYSAAIDGVYQRLASLREPRFVLLEDVVSMITNQPVDANNPFPPELLFAVSNALIRERFGFIIETRSYSWTRVICVQPLENAVIVERVQRWLRAYQEDAGLAAGGFEVPRGVSQDALFVKSFVRKCAKLVEESRSLRQHSPDGIVIGSRPVPPGTRKLTHSLEFSDSDREFIRVLKLHTMGESLFRHPTYRSLSSIILRAVGVYGDSELREDMCWNFLVEIGVVDPYTQPQAFDSEVWPPNAEVTDGLIEVEAQLKNGKNLNEVLSLQDSMQHLRRDLGQLPVYCIDSEGTEEVDDGISLERIPDEPDNFWLHVHLAHVSAFATRANLIGKCAEHRLTSMYMSDGRLTMLPRWASSEYSLAPNRPCITYSTKVNQNGETLNYKIQPATMRNVLYMTPAMVNSVLGHLFEGAPEKPPHFTIQCGQIPDKIVSKPLRPLTQPSEENAQDLRDLVELARKVRSQRTISAKGSVFMKDTLLCTVGNLKGDSRSTTVANPTHARFNLQDPFIELQINHDVDESSPDKVEIKGRPRDNADMMVEQLMLLANVTAGKWAKDRNIPIIYTGTRQAVEGLDAITALAKEEVRKGAYESYILHTLISLYALRVFTTFPVEQKIMGVPEYAKVTSPLRRFFDLVSSWQIDAALRFEHENGKSLTNRTESDHSDGNTNVLPYTREEIETSLRIWVARSQDINWYSNANTSHWIVLAIARAFYLKEAPLPSQLTCEIGRVQGTKVRGQLRELEFSVEVTTTLGPDGTALKDGDIWEVEIFKVIPFTRSVMVTPLRRLVESRRKGYTSTQASSAKRPVPAA